MHITHMRVYHLKSQMTDKSTNNPCNVPCNQHSNSLLSINHREKLKNAEFYRFLTEFDRFLAGPPAGDGDFLRSPPTLAKLLSGGSLGVTEMLF
jgi:hypothetical protein